MLKYREEAVKTVIHAFDGLPIWPRLSLAGLLWGMLWGVLVAVAVLLAMFSAGVAADGLDWQGLPTLLAGIIVCLGVGGGFGATVGGLIGFLTGVLGGTILLVLLRFAGPRSAAFSTVVAVCAIQVAAGLLLFEGVWAGLALAAPLLGAVPMTLVALGASYQWAGQHVARDHA